MSIKAVQDWAKAGMPRTKIGTKKYTYDLDEVFEWKALRDNNRAGAEGVLSPKELTSLGALGNLKARIEHYRINRADIFAAKQIENFEQQNRLRAIRLKDKSDDELREMQEKDAIAWFKGLGVDSAIMYDKEELERSKGVDDVHKVLDAILKAKEILHQ